MKFTTRLAVITMSVVMMTAMSVNAQQMPWGTGMAMGQQACPYNVQAGEGASSYLDEYREVEKAKADEKSKLSDLNRKKRKLERDMDRARDTLNRTIDAQYADTVIAHMDNTRLCTDYDYDKLPEEKSRANGDEGGKSLKIPPAEVRGGRRPQSAQEDLTPRGAFSPAQWSQVCLPGRGRVSPVVCTEKTYSSGENRGYSATDCKRALEKYSKGSNELDKLQSDISRSEALVERYTDELPDIRRDAEQRYREDRRARTEGDLCVNCMAQGSGYVTQRTGPDWAGVAANVGVGLLAMYAGYKTNKMVAEYNSDLGWPTQAYPAWGYGLPFLANGIYGALGGGVGGGAFGCAGGVGGGGFPMGAMGGMGPFGMGPGLYGNVGMNGAFGYPYGMAGYPMGGGMYGGGMGPFGPGIGFGGGFGAGMGMPGMYPGMGMGMGMPGMGMGMPGMGMGMPGMGMGGGFGLGMGMPGMGMGGMYPGMGMGMPGMGLGGGFGLGMGMPGMGMGGMYPGMGIGMPGMYPGMGGSMYPGMGGMYPGMGGMYPGMGGMPGMYPPGMGGMPGMYDPYGMGGMGGLGGMQYQQAMMQMQMQQYQMAMQQQQQAMQSAMARQQTIAGLQSEMYSLMYKIQQVQMGGNIGYIGGGGSYYGGGGGSYYGGGGYNNGTVLPAPGSGINTMPYPANNGGGTIPGGVVIPAGSNR